MRRKWWGVVVLCAAAVCAPLVAHAGTQQSYWNATDWYVVFHRDDEGDVIGHFNKPGELLTGIMITMEERLDGQLVLLWWQRPSSNRSPPRTCNESRAGSDYWGWAVIQPDGSGAFRGYRTECDDPRSTAVPFNAVLVGGQPWWMSPSNPVAEPRHPELDVTRSQAVAVSNGAVPTEVPDRDVQELILDYDCDGGLDYVLGWLDADHPEGPYYQMTVGRWQARPDGQRPVLSALTYRIPFEPRDRGYLCEPDSSPGAITINELELTDDVVARYDLNDRPENCRHAILIENGLCPGALFYWARDSRYSVSTTLE